MMQRPGIRVRLTTLATVIVGVALTLGAFLLVGTLRSRLDEAATTAAQLRARDIAALADVDALPRQLALPGEESAFVQVVDADDRVVASTENIEGEPAIATVRPTGSERLLLTTGIPALDDAEPMRVAALNVTTDDGVVTIYAGESLRDVTDTTAAVILLLLIGTPLLTLIVAVVTWWAVGRTLRPIRAITDAMFDITTSDLHRRVPLPGVDDEIGELAATVNATLARLDESVATQRRFVADASHELRGPLAALRADLEISVTHPDKTAWTDVARDTLGDVERLQHLTDDLLLLARLDARHRSAGETTDLVAIVHEAVGQIRRDDIAVSVMAPADGAIVHGDPEQLHRMVRNLVHNAAEHAVGHVQIRLTADDGEVSVAVSDDGVGIPIDDRERVFERFVRLDAARTRKAGGTGLGLAIVRDVVVNHRGTVDVTDGELGGATFTVVLPT